MNREALGDDSNEISEIIENKHRSPNKVDKDGFENEEESFVSSYDV